MCPVFLTVKGSYFVVWHKFALGFVGHKEYKMNFTVCSLITFIINNYFSYKYYKYT